MLDIFSHYCPFCFCFGVFWNKSDPPTPNVAKSYQYEECGRTSSGPGILHLWGDVMCCLLKPHDVWECGFRTKAIYKFTCRMSRQRGVPWPFLCRKDARTICPGSNIVRLEGGRAQMRSTLRTEGFGGPLRALKFPRVSNILINLWKI